MCIDLSVLEIASDLPTFFDEENFFYVIKS